eukprot:3188868-Amphidinium_carterae.1
MVNHRFVHAVDSQVALGVLVKGRSSSVMRNQILLKSIPLFWLAPCCRRTYSLERISTLLMRCRDGQTVQGRCVQFSADSTVSAATSRSFADCCKFPRRLYGDTTRPFHSSWIGWVWCIHWLLIRCQT